MRYVIFVSKCQDFKISSDAQEESQWSWKSRIAVLPMIHSNSVDDKGTWQAIRDTASFASL